MNRGLEDSPPSAPHDTPERTGPYVPEQAAAADYPAISEFEILGELGRGGMGVVYRAKDVRLGRRVALKFLPEQYAQDRRRLERFQREARTASALNHPHICTIYSLQEYQGQPFLVMELIEGRTLRTLAAQHPALGVVARLGGQAAEALAVAHAAGIVHRDIKPDNLMVRDDGYLKVLDFGLACLLPASPLQAVLDTGEGTPSGTVVGTTRYLSPEQARGETAGSASDIFSLGIVLYELATGRHPFPADSRLGVMHAILSEPPLPPSRLQPGLSAVWDALLLQMLEKDAGLRPAAADVAQVLATLPGDQGARPPAEEAPPVQRHTVGRAKELAELRAGFDSAGAGRGLLLCVAGEPGIGKTTLVEDFAASLAAEGQAFHLARGRCSERLAGAEAYLPILDALESLLRGEGGERAARVMRLVAPTWFVQVAPRAAGDAAFDQALAEAKIASQERMKREFVAFLQEVSALRPLVLIIDDMHWADPSTVDLLAYVGGKCVGLRALFVLTYRPTELALGKHPFLAVKLDLQGRGVCRDLPVAFLGTPDVERYLELEYPGHRFPAEFAALVHGKTEGNPLFMVDLLRYLRDGGVIAQEHGGWSLAQAVPEVERELPESVRSLIQRKIDQAGEADRRLLAAASVQGNEFDAAVVARALALDAAEAEERLQALDGVHALVRRVGEKEFPDGTLTLRYRFVHVLYQNTLYEGLTPARKASWSAAVAQALLGYYGEQSGTVAAELALLFEPARDFARASDYFLVASRNAARVHANQEAVALARRAVASAEKLPGKDRHRRVLAAAFHLAELHRILSQFQDAIVVFQMAERVAGEAGDTESQISAVSGMGMALYPLSQVKTVSGTGASLLPLRRLAELRELGDRALEMARIAQSDMGKASAELVLGMERVIVGDLDAAERYMECALPMLREKGAPLYALDGIIHRGAIHMWRSEYEEAVCRGDEALERAQKLDGSFNIFPGLFQRGFALGNLGRLSEALATLEEGRRLAELNGDRYWLCRFPNTLGWLYRELHDLESALRLDTEGVHLAREVGFSKAEANSHINLGHDYLWLGEPARALEHLHEAQRFYDGGVFLRWRFNIRLQAELASHAAARGDLTRAASHAVTSLQQAEKVAARKHMAWAHKLLADIAALEERMEDARRHQETALHILAGHPCPVIEWRILKAAADVARRLHDDATADQFRGRAQAVVQALADSVRDGNLRQRFLASQPIREL
jgi:tetratricopeptide (TPR) repeat protein